MKKIKIEGFAQIGEDGSIVLKGIADFDYHDITYVCEKCGHQDTAVGMEYNFREKKVYCPCRKCKHTNTMVSGNIPMPYPRTRM